MGTIRLSVRVDSSWNRAVLHVFADSVSTIATNFPQVGTPCTGGLVESQASNPTSIRRGIASPSVRKAQRTRMPEARSALLGSYVPGSSLQAVPPLVRRSNHMEAFRISSQSRIRASAALEEQFHAFPDRRSRSVHAQWQYGNCSSTRTDPPRFTLGSQREDRRRRNQGFGSP